MRCLSYSECAEWCRHRNYPVMESDAYGRPAPAVREHYREIPLRYPTDSGEKVALAREVIRWLEDDELLLWIGEWGVWSSSQHMPLFTRFRQALGEARPLIEAPGHLLARDEIDDAVSVLATSMLFFWDCYVFGGMRNPTFVCSHDEWNGFFIPPDLDTAPVIQGFSNWLGGSGHRYGTDPEA